MRQLSDIKVKKPVSSSGTAHASTDDAAAQALSARVKFLRQYLGMTQAELARELGTKAQVIGGWERGVPKYAIGLHYAIELARRYNVTLDFLFLGKPEALPLRMERAYRGLD